MESFRVETQAAVPGSGHSVVSLLLSSGVVTVQKRHAMLRLSQRSEKWISLEKETCNHLKICAAVGARQTSWLSQQGKMPVQPSH